jgi:hypothetical protein
VTLLLCKVLVGASSDIGDAQRPDLAREPDGFDSVTGTATACGGTRMWAVYSKDRAYTAYSVTVQLATPCHTGAHCGSLHAPVGDAPTAAAARAPPPAKAPAAAPAPGVAAAAAAAAMSRC